ncbi:general secretion pathway protein GspK [Candidatus Sumerlaeota bacterium]|nr:general secretion pathway protein GspK [Candidatus Sumerlaeota bacterium]
MKRTGKRLQSRRDRAVILVLVLWIIVILSLMAYSMLYQVSSETTIISTRKKQLQAEAFARAGVAKAVVDLRNDLLFDNVEGEKNFDGEGDIWARPEEGKLDAEIGNNKSGTFSVHVYDEDGLININRINGTNMVLLQKIIERIGYTEEDAKLVTAAIVDWRDGDFVPVLPSSPSNDEGKAYAMIQAENERARVTDENEVQPYVFRNEDFISVEELLEVYGVTPELFFGPDSPEAEYFRAQLPDRFEYGDDHFKMDERELRRRTRGSRNDEPQPGLRDYLTVYGSGTININTAPQHVLAAFAEAAGNTDGDSWAERVIRERRGGKEDNIDNDNAFKDGTALQANAEVQGVLAGGGALLPIGVNSTTFRIVSEGVVGDVRVRIEALAARALTPLTRDETFESIDRSEERRKNEAGRWKRRENSGDSTRVNYPYVRIFQVFEE